MGDLYDRVFLRQLHHIERLLRSPRGADLGKAVQIRVERWIAKLSSDPAISPEWKRERNRYAALLLEQLRKQELSEPFHTMPSVGMLPSLPPWLGLAASRLETQARRQEQKRDVFSEAYKRVERRMEAESRELTGLGSSRQSPRRDMSPPRTSVAAPSPPRSPDRPHHGHTHQSPPRPTRTPAMLIGPVEERNRTPPLTTAFDDTAETLTSADLEAIGAMEAVARRIEDGVRRLQESRLEATKKDHRKHQQQRRRRKRRDSSSSSSSSSFESVRSRDSLRGKEAKELSTRKKSPKKHSKQPSTSSSPFRIRSPDAAEDTALRVLQAQLEASHREAAQLKRVLDEERRQRRKKESELRKTHRAHVEALRHIVPTSDTSYPSTFAPHVTTAPTPSQNDAGVYAPPPPTRTQVFSTSPKKHPYHSLSVPEVRTPHHDPPLREYIDALGGATQRMAQAAATLGRQARLQNISPPLH